MTSPLARYLGALAIVAACVVVVAAAARTPLLPLLPGAVRVPTNDHDPGLGVTVLCTLGRSIPSVSGRLAGDYAAADGFPGSRMPATAAPPSCCLAGSPPASSRSSS